MEKKEEETNLQDNSLNEALFQFSYSNNTLYFGLTAPRTFPASGLKGLKI